MEAERRTRTSPLVRVHTFLLAACRSGVITQRHSTSSSCRQLPPASLGLLSFQATRRCCSTLKSASLRATAGSHLLRLQMSRMPCRYTPIGLHPTSIRWWGGLTYAVGAVMYNVGKWQVRWGGTAAARPAGR